MKHLGRYLGYSECSEEFTQLYFTHTMPVNLDSASHVTNILLHESGGTLEEIEICSNQQYDKEQIQNLIIFA